jgi:hypothetical protein
MAGKGSGGSSGHGGGGGSGQGNGSSSGQSNGSDNGTATNNGQAGNNDQNWLKRTDEQVGGGYKNEPQPDGKPPEGFNPGEVTHSDNGVHFEQSYSNGTVGFENDASAYAENGTAFAGFESEVFAGPVSSNTSGYARGDAHFEGFDSVSSVLAGEAKVQLGAEAQVKQEYTLDAGPVDVSVSGNARVAAGFNHTTTEKTQIGLEATVGAEAKVGTGGNEVTVGVSKGFGVGGEIIHGEDSDGDGKAEFGLSLKLAFVVGGSIGFKFEPEAVLDGAKDLLGLGEKSPKERLCACTEQFESVLEMKQSNEAYDRLQSLL